MVSTEVERYSDDVDPAEVPSAKWGWSKINYRTWHIAGFGAIVFLLPMLHGNHVGQGRGHLPAHLRRPGRSC